jgi:hypothetical protein
VEKITVSGIPNCVNYCVIFVVYTQFTSVVVGLQNTMWWVECHLQAVVWSVTDLDTRWGCVFLFPSCFTPGEETHSTD